MSSIFSKANIWNYTALVLAIFMLTTPFFIYPTLVSTGPAWFGLDCSWQMALNYAIIKHWVWGQEIAFGYGPLVFLSTRLGFGISKWVFILFDLFWVFNFFMLFKDLIKECENKLLAILLIIATLLVTGPFAGTDTCWVITIFSFYWMYKIMQAPQYRHYFILSACITLCFYIKLNIGIFGMLFYAGLLLTQLAAKRLKIIKALSLSLIPVSFIIVTGYLLHVSFTGYVHNALEILKGHNDIMYLHEEHPTMESMIAVIYYAILILLISYSILLFRRKNFEQLFFVAVSAVYLFIFKKQATGRNDVQHLSEFFHYAPLVLIYGNILFYKKHIQKIFLVTTLLIFSVSIAYTRQGVFIPFIKYRAGVLSNYYKGIKSYDTTTYLQQANKRYIPPQLITKIGSSTIDVFPWDIEYLLENKLNYQPRPMLQSYLAYTAYLANEDYDQYTKAPPEFVLYDYESIDNRYPFNDEPMVNFFITSNYRFVDSFTSNERWRILLQKNKQTHPIQLQKINEAQQNIASVILSQRAQFMKINIAYNLKGKLLALYDKPPAIEILFITKYGEHYKYKTSTQLLRTGIMPNKLVLNNQDFSKLIQNKADSLKDIDSLQLVLDTNYFAPKMKIERYKIN